MPRAFTMYLFVLIAAIGLVPIYHYRRRWQAPAILVVSLGVIELCSMGLASMVTHDIDPAHLPPGVVAGPPGSMLPSMVITYQALFASIGITLAVLPRNRTPGSCGSCGYDLRGLSGSVCPECGTGFDVSVITLELEQHAVAGRGGSLAST